MKKIFTLIAVAAMAMSANAQTEGTITWSLAENQNGVANPTDVATATDVVLGEGLVYAETQYWTWDGVPFTQFTSSSDDAKGDNKYETITDLKKNVDFKFTASKDFTISKVTFNMVKRGTGDPQIFIDYIDANGTVNHVSDNAAIDIARKNDDGVGHTGLSYDIASTVAAGKDFTFRIWVGKLATNKQVGIANVVINGTSSGASGINTVKAVEAENGAAYNLAGQQVDKSYKGVVIQNGVKRIQK